jgi:outer membrane protein
MKRLAMKSVLKWTIAGCIAIASVAAHAQENIRVGVVNVEKLLRESAPAKAAQSKLEAEFGKRDKDLQDQGARLRGLVERLERDGPVMAEAERQRRQREVVDLEKEFTRKQRELREAFSERRNEEQAQLEEKIRRSIKQVADADKVDLVLGDGVLYINSRIDITDKVLRALATVK